MADQWYYDTETGQAVQGKEAGWENRMGPYPAREAAEHAIETARRRNEKWDAQDD